MIARFSHFSQKTVCDRRRYGAPLQGRLRARLHGLEARATWHGHLGHAEDVQTPVRCMQRLDPPTPRNHLPPNSGRHARYNAPIARLAEATEKVGNGDKLESVYLTSLLQGLTLCKSR